MKKILALLLSLLMVLSQLSLTTVAFADETSQNESEPAPAVLPVSINYVTLPDPNCIPSSGAYYLTSDVILSGNYQNVINGDLHLDLRGFNIYTASTASSQGTIRDDSANGYTIEITDTVGGGTINGADQTQNAFIFTGGSSKTKVSLSNVTFKNFSNSNTNAGGVCVFQGANTSVKIDNCVFKDINKSAGHAGAIYSSCGSCKIMNSDFINVSGKKSGEAGGAIRNTKNMQIYNCEFVNCMSVHGGALGNSGGGSLDIYGGSFTDCSVTGNGGAIYITNGTLTINDYVDGQSTVHTVFNNNKPGTAGAGGAIYYQDTAAKSTITGAVFSNNTSAKAGGAIRVDGGGLTLNSCSFTGNRATQGAAVHTASGIGLDIKDSTFTGNTSTDTTGCVIVCQGITTLSGKTIIKDNLSTNAAAAEKKNIRMSSSAGNNSINVAGLTEGSDVYVAPSATSLKLSSANKAQEGYVHSDAAGYKLSFDNETNTLGFVPDPQLAVDKMDIVITEGAEQIVKATVSPDFLTNKNVTWDVQDANTATVTPIDGTSATITGVAIGSTTVTVISAYDTSLTKTINVTVTEKHIHDGKEYLPWNADASAAYKTSLPKSGYYYLTSDVALSAQQLISANDTELHICLNGFSISSSYKSGGQGLFRCDKTGVKLEIRNCQETGCIDGSGQSVNGFIFAGSGSSVDVTLNNLTIKNFKNTSANSGAVLCLQSASKVTAIDCKFDSNGGCKNGGVIWQGSNGASTFTNCEFTKNTSSDAAGVAMISNGSGSITFDGCTFTENKGLHGSVAAYGAAHGSLIFKDCILTNNIDLGTASSTGAIYVTNSNKKLTIEGKTVIKDNYNSAVTPVKANLCLQDANAVFSIQNPTEETELNINVVTSKADNAIFATLASGSWAGTYNYTSNTAKDLYKDGANLVIDTASTHIHDGIKYRPWTKSDSIPRSGDWFLTKDVTLSAQQTITSNDVTLRLCLNGYTISSNYTSGGQGVIRCDKTGVKLELMNCQTTGYIDGSGQSINGFIFAGSGSSVDVKLNDLTIKNFKNTSANSGAVLCLQTASAVTAKNCVFDNNGGCKNGGVIWQGSNGASTFTNCEFTKNTSSDAAGVAMISNGSGSISFDGCTFTENKGLHGSVAAFGSLHGELIFKDCELTDNTDLAATVSTGAIYVNNSNKKLTLIGANVIKDNYNSAAIPARADLCLQDSSAVFTLKNPTSATDVYFNTCSTGGVLNKINGSVIATLAEGSLAGNYKFTSVSGFDTDVVLSGSNIILKTIMTDHDHGDGWAAWKNDKSLPSASDAVVAGTSKFYLTKNVTTSAAVALISSELTLCLNGHSIFVGGVNSRMYRLSNGGALTLMNCDESGYIKRITEGKNSTDGYINGGIIGVFKDADTDAECAVNVIGIAFKGISEGYDAGAGGAIYSNTGSTYIKDCTFDGFKSNGNGGAVSVFNQSSFSIKGTSSFTNNTATGNGGAVRIEGSNASISDNVSFTGNTVGEDGGALYIFKTIGSTVDNVLFKDNTAKAAGALNIGRGKTTVTNCTFTNNTATASVNAEGKKSGGNAGAIVVSGYDEIFGNGYLVLKNCTLTENSADNMGGALFLSQPAQGLVYVAVSDCSFSNNKSVNAGGAIYVSRNDENTSNPGSKIKITNSIFDSNEGTTGGAVYSQGELEINGGTYSNNKATTDGGAIYCTGVGMTFTMNGGIVKNNSVYKNSSVTGSSGRGGGIMLWGRGAGINIGSINGVTISGNYAENYAGGLYVGNGSLELNDTAIDSNKAGSDSAGIAIGGNGVLSMGNGCSVSNNTAKLATGIAIQKNGKLRLSGGTISGNVATTGGGAGIYVVAGGELAMTGGTISGNKSKGNGGGITINATEQDTYAGYISGGTIKNNSSEGDGAGLWISAAKITISATIKDNTTTSAAGGINARGLADVTLSNCEISGNKARNGGGVVATSGAKLTVKGSSFTKNEANPGAGAALFIVGNEAYVAELHLISGEIYDNYAFGNAGAIYSGGVFTMDGGTIRNNNCGYYGGALYLSDKYCKFTMNGGVITENVSGADGGAILGRGTAELIMNDGTISNNTANTHGGGMLIQSYATFTMNGGVWDGNSSGGTGGAIRTTDNVININGGTFSNNTTGGQGGAIYTGGTFTAKNVLFDGNKVSGTSTQYESYGGAFCDNGGTAVFENCTFTNNSSNGQGGAGAGLYSKALITYNNCTFAQNYAGNYGGALAGFGATSITVNDSTIKENKSGYGGGAVSLRGGPTMSFDNTVIENNTSIQGGAFLVDMGNRLNLVKSTIKGNSATTDGGAIHTAGIVLIEDTEIISNTSGAQGAVVIDGTVNDPKLQLVLSKVSFKGSVKIHDNNGGDIFNGKRSIMNIVNVNSLTDDALIYVTLERGNISSNLTGSYDYELIGEKSYKITNGTLSLTSPEAYELNDDPKEEQTSEAQEENTEESGFPLIGWIGIVAGGAVVAGGITFTAVSISKKRKTKV